MAGIAIAIPTYNRPELLERNLRAMLPEIVAVGATVYVSDDSDNDETATRIAALRETHPFIHYRRNRPALRHDANLVSTLRWPTEDYVWLLGDARRIVPGILTKLAGFASDQQDMIFVNVHAPLSYDRPVLNGAALEPFIRSHVWHQTLTGATVYARSVIDWIGAHHVVTYRNFPQLSIILGFLEKRGGTVGWMDDISLISDSKDSYWEARALDVFVDDWVKVITAHATLFPPVIRPAILKDHSIRHNVFGAERLLRLKKNGAFGRHWLRHPHFFDVMNLSPLQVTALAVLPASLTGTAVTAMARIRRLRAFVRRSVTARNSQAQLNH